MSAVALSPHISFVVVLLDFPSFGPFFFFFNDTATTEIYTLSLHDALPICRSRRDTGAGGSGTRPRRGARTGRGDRKSTRLNSSHLVISYAVFCLKKKKKSIVAHSTPTAHHIRPLAGFMHSLPSYLHSASEC